MAGLAFFTACPSAMTTSCKCCSCSIWRSASTDTNFFGSGYQTAFRDMTSLIEDLKTDPTTGSLFSRLKPGSEAFSAFVRNLAFERAGQLKRRFNAERREGLVATFLPPFTSFWSRYLAVKR